MKRILLVLTLCIASATVLQAQKVYSTKSGKISFFSKTPVEDIEATNNDVESKLASATGQVVFMLLINGFQFENQLMEEHFNENYLESDKFPKSDFKGFITNFKTIDLARDGVYPATVKGDLTIHGVSKPMEATGTLEVKGGRLTAKTRFNVRLKEFNISGGVIGKKVAESIMVDVNCQYE